MANLSLVDSPEVVNPNTFFFLCMPVKRGRGRPRESRDTRVTTTAPIRRSPGRPRGSQGRRGGWQVLPRPTYFCCDLLFLSFSLMLILFNVSWYLWIDFLLLIKEYNSKMY